MLHNFALFYAEQVKKGIILIGNLYVTIGYHKITLTDNVVNFDIFPLP